MSKQLKLIGSHPGEEHPLGAWLVVNDIPITPTKCHRELTERGSVNYEKLIDWMANKLITHHHANSELENLKKKYKELGFDHFAKYAGDRRKLPIVDKVKKGNATEILLIEYIQSCSERQLIHSFRLRYNPNVDQSMKGDDVLMVECFEKNNVPDIKIFFGEAKFRSAPSKDAVDKLSSSLKREKLPVSYTFLLGVIKENKEMHEILDNFIVQDIKDKGQLIYTGLLLSNERTSSCVEKHLKNDNPDLIFISIGIKDPQQFINLAFEKANQIIANPSAL